MHLCCICLWAVHKHWARWWEWKKRANHLFTQSRITHSAFTLFTNYSPYTSSAEKTMCALHFTQLQHTLESVPDTECSSPISCNFCNHYVQMHKIENCIVPKVECMVHTFITHSAFWCTTHCLQPLRVGLKGTSRTQGRWRWSGGYFTFP